MRAALLVLSLFASSALADVGPRPPPCSVPTACVTCVNNAGDADAGCAAGALDAGLVLSECSDRSGSVLSSYYCPKDQPAVRSCGCATVDVVGLAGLGVFLPRLLRRRVSRA